MRELFSGANGQLSSKRVGGFVGLFLMLAITLWGVYQNPSSFVDALQVWALLVGGLLGVGVAESFAKPKQASHEATKPAQNTGAGMSHLG